MALFLHKVNYKAGNNALPLVFLDLTRCYVVGKYGYLYQRTR